MGRGLSKVQRGILDQIAAGDGTATLAALMEKQFSIRLEKRMGRAKWGHGAYVGQSVNARKASLSRAIARLKQRGLVEGVKLQRKGIQITARGRQQLEYLRRLESAGVNR
jgi:hypothetical protein